MNSHPRHQCLIYDGSPSRHLHVVAAAASEMLRKNYRCLYLNSGPMVAGMRSYLAAAGVDVAREIEKTSLVLSSDRDHLIEGRHFDADGMMRTLESALQQALQEGYAGLWSSGDMSWEFGPDPDFSRLVDYEWRLEEFFEHHPQLSGVCQYHADLLPRDAMRNGLLTHPSLFVNETLTLINPHYLSPAMFLKADRQYPDLDTFLDRLCQQYTGN